MEMLYETCLTQGWEEDDSISASDVHALPKFLNGPKTPLTEEINIGTVHVTCRPCQGILRIGPGNKVTMIKIAVRASKLVCGGPYKKKRNGGPYSFVADAYLPTDSMRGELAESWYWEDPLTLVIKLREGIIFPEKEGIMEAREFVADDVVYSFALVNESPKRIPTYFDHKRLEARDDHTVVFHLRHYNAEWPYRFGYGYYSGISMRNGKGDRKRWSSVRVRAICSGKRTDL